MKNTSNILFVLLVCLALDTTSTQATVREKITTAFSTVQGKTQELKKIVAQKGSDISTNLIITRIKDILSCGLSAGIITTAAWYQWKSIEKLTKDLDEAEGELKAYGKFLARSTFSWVAIIASLRSLQKNPVGKSLFS